MIWLVVFLLIATPALANDFAVTDRDQAAIQQICDTAAASPSLLRDARAQVATWCVLWEKRIQEANKQEQPKTDTEEKNNQK